MDLLLSKLSILFILICLSYVGFGSLNEKDVEKDFVSISSTRKRSLDRYLRVQMSPFGTKKEYRLYRTATAIFARKVSIYKSYSIGKYRSISKKVAEMNGEKMNRRFYTSQDGKTNVYIKHSMSFDSEKKLSMEGLLDSNVYITPDWEKRVDPDIHKDHIVYRRKAEVNDTQKDTVALFDPPSQFESISREKRNSSVPECVYIEVGVIVDHYNSQVFMDNYEELLTYYGNCYLSANYKFKNVKDPYIQLVIKKIILNKNIASYVKDNIVSPDTVELKIIGSLAKHCAKDPILQDCDIVMLHLGGFRLKGAYGVAYVGKLCHKGVIASFNVAVADDTAPYCTATVTITHEIAHQCGAVHDGDRNFERCPANKGYLLGIKQWDRNMFYLSNCTKTSMSEYFKSGKGSCAYNRPFEIIPDPYVNTMPGFFINHTEECQLKYGESYQKYMYKTENEMCTKPVRCVNGRKVEILYRMPMDGFPCSKDKACIAGNCSLTKENLYEYL